MEPLTAGLIAAAPKLLGGLFSFLSPKPYQPLPTAPPFMNGGRAQLVGEAPRQGPSPGQLVLDGLLSGGVGALGAYAQQPTVDDAAKITGEQTSLLAPKGTASPGTLGISPLLRSNAAAIELMGQTPSSYGLLNPVSVDPPLTYEQFLQQEMEYKLADGLKFK